MTNVNSPSSNLVLAISILALLTLNSNHLISTGFTPSSSRHGNNLFHKQARFFTREDSHHHKLKNFRERIMQKEGGSRVELKQSSNSVNEGQISVLRPDDDKEYKLSYRIVRPRSLSSQTAAPILVLHGGPSVPSNYLYSLEQDIPYRSIIFYDQIGCGSSDEPDDVSAYSIDYAVDDLELLIKKLGVRRFHLYGQSYGGILGFEYLKRQAEKEEQDGDKKGCLSVILSSTPMDVAQVEAEADRLISNLQSASEENEDNDNDDDNDEEEVDMAELFRTTHQCRTPTKPPSLVEAYEKAGTVWRGTDAIPNYVATPPNKIEGQTTRRMPSAMILRGEHDFVTEPCVEGWKTVFDHKFVRYKTIQGCSHHGLLENGQLYGEIVDSFFSEYD